MKKEYIILLLVITALCAYLFLHKENKTNYTLPKITAVKTDDIAQLNIDKNKRDILFTKDDDNWFVTDKKYPADNEKVKAMLNVIAKLNVSDLVSRSNDLTRYELDPKHRIEALAKNDSGDVLRKFDIGKTAPTYKHTFIKIGNDNNVYYADGNFRSDFDYDVDGFRDKSVLSFKVDSIIEVSVKKGKKQRTFILTALNSSAKKIKASPAKKWKSTDNFSFNTQDLKELLSELSDLNCSGYTGDDSEASLKLKTPLCTINLKDTDNINKKKISISIFPANKDGNYPGISTANKFPFFLDSYEGKNIISKADALIAMNNAGNKQKNEHQKTKNSKQKHKKKKNNAHK